MSVPARCVPVRPAPWAPAAHTQVMNELLNRLDGDEGEDGSIQELYTWDEEGEEGEEEEAGAGEGEEEAYEEGEGEVALEVEVEGEEGLGDAELGAGSEAGDEGGYLDEAEEGDGR